MQNSGIQSVLGTRQTEQTSNQAIRELDMDEFLELMIAELQNQDPLDPMENNDLLQQISQIREIGATTQLSETLEAVLLGQNLSSASSLIDRQIKALSNDGEIVSGKVDRVSILSKNVNLHIGEHRIPLANVSEILP